MKAKTRRIRELEDATNALEELTWEEAVSEPFDWWHSGRNWYCSVQMHGVGTVSGCGVTKDRAIADAHRDLSKLYHRRIATEDRE